MNIWWAPGQTKATNEICTNLAVREKILLSGLTLSFGFCGFGFFAVLMDVAVGFGPFHQYLEDLPRRCFSPSASRLGEL